MPPSATTLIVNTWVLIFEWYFLNEVQNQNSILLLSTSFHTNQVLTYVSSNHAGLYVRLDLTDPRRSHQHEKESD